MSAHRSTLHNEETPQPGRARAFQKGQEMTATQTKVPRQREAAEAAYGVLRSIEEQGLRATLDMAGRPWRRWSEIFFVTFADDLPIQPPPPRYPNATAQQLAQRLRREALGWSR